MENQLVIFELEGENYGVDIAAVEGIIKIQEITSVPHAPEFVEGIINLRGAVLPVIDMRKRFGLELVEVTRDTRIIVVETALLTSDSGTEGTAVGMIVDAVNEVLRIPAEDIEPPSPMVTTVDSTFITGIAKVDERLIILLDLGQVLSMQEQAELQVLPVLS